MFNLAQKAVDTVGRIDPVARATQQLGARMDPAGNVLGIYGSKAPKPIAGDVFGDALGLYGKDTAAYDAQTYENARMTAIQQGETDMNAVNQRTSAMLANDGQHGRKTGLMLLGGD